jgi:hypothetical protein
MICKSNELKKHLRGCHEQLCKKGHICPQVIYDLFFWRWHFYKHRVSKEKKILKKRCTLCVFPLFFCRKESCFLMTDQRICPTGSTQRSAKLTVWQVFIPLLKRFPDTVFPESTAYMNFSSARIPRNVLSIGIAVLRSAKLTVWQVFRHVLNCKFSTPGGENRFDHA